jgi:hypothetical protein
MATTILPVAATSTAWPELAILTEQSRHQRFSQAHRIQKMRSWGSVLLHKKSLPRPSGDLPVLGMDPDEGCGGMEGADEVTICWRLEEMPQLRRDVEQSTIGYESAYHGKGGWVIFGKDPS